jgi:hypothetical protein
MFEPQSEFPSFAPKKVRSQNQVVRSQSQKPDKNEGRKQWRHREDVGKIPSLPLRPTFRASLLPTIRPSAWPLQFAFFLTSYSTHGAE